MILGPIIVSIEGKKLSEHDRHTLQHDLIGGVILFSENYEDREQLMELVRSIKKVKSPELIVCVDQEGGRVQRLGRDFINCRRLMNWERFMIEQKRRD